MQAMDHGFSMMPMDLLLVVMTDFLHGDCEDICAMDIACAPSVREVFLTALACPGFHVRLPKSANEMSSLSAWVRLRHSQLHQLTVRWSQLRWLEPQFAEELSSVLEVKLLKDALNCDRYLEPFFACCTHLQAIELVELSFYPYPTSSINPALEALIARRPLVHLKSLLCSRRIVVDYYESTVSQRNCVCKIATAFYATLEEMDLQHYCSLTEREMRALLACTRLRTLAIRLAGLDRAVLQDLMSSLPALRHLTIRCDSYFTAQSDESVIKEIAQYFAELHSLVFGYDESLCPAKVFAVLLSACPALAALNVPKISYKRIWDGVGCAGCRLSIRCALEPDTANLLFAACPVPVIGLFFKGSPHLLGSVDFHGASKLCSCRTVTLIDACVRPGDRGLMTMAMHRIADCCQQLREFRLTDADDVTDAGVQAVLQRCGPQLVKLTIMRCKKLSKRILLAIIENCTDLEELTLIQTAITINELLDQLILPDHLRKLCKLTVGVRTFNVICAQQMKRWSDIVRSIPTDSDLTQVPVAQIFI